MVAGLNSTCQEAAQGKYAWIIHGILWTFFHTFKYWEFLAILPSALAIPFVVSHRKNSWPAIVAHLLVNVWVPIYMWLLVLGVA